MKRFDTYQERLSSGPPGFSPGQSAPLPNLSRYSRKPVVPQPTSHTPSAVSKLLDEPPEESPRFPRATVTARSVASTPKSLGAGFSDPIAAKSPKANYGLAVCATDHPEGAPVVLLLSP